MSNTDDRVEALKNSTDERDSSVSWSRRVSGIATRGSKCYLRIGHHHTHRMARPRVCVGDNALLSQKMHYYHSARDACDHRVNTTTCTTQLTQTLDTAQGWRSDASSFLGGVSPSGATSRPQPHNATTTTTQRLSRVNTAVTENSAKQTKHSNRGQRPRENGRASGGS